MSDPNVITPKSDNPIVNFVQSFALGQARGILYSLAGGLATAGVLGQSQEAGFVGASFFLISAALQAFDVYVVDKKTPNPAFPPKAAAPAAPAQPQ